jgi:hypothetical protein
MLESERLPGRAAHPNVQFDSETVRRILQRAAAEQHRLDNELADSYSLEELEEMAAEVRISPEALRAAIEADRRSASSIGAGADIRHRADGRPRDWLAALEGRLPEVWSPAVKQMALAGVGFIALSGLLLSLSMFAPTLFWVTSLSLIALCLLGLSGGSPF